MPGHCVNQIVLHQPESGYLISADMLLRNTAMPMIDRAIDDPKGKTKSMVQLLDSYERLQELHLTKIFPGHWEFKGDPFEVIEWQLAAIHKKVAITLDLVRGGLSDFTDILDQIYPGKRIPPTFFMVLGFLDILIEQEKVSIQKEGGFLKYYAN
jgi:glyoxylase-like metal-dependent hydrolase (beta-lactamase superfamily II)